MTAGSRGVKEVEVASCHGLVVLHIVSVSVLLALPPIRTSMARNARQINASVGAEVFSVSQQQLEKYGSRASNKPRDFNYIKNPYQIPGVQRSREKRPRENAGGDSCRCCSPEVR